MSRTFQVFHFDLFGIRGVFEVEITRGNAVTGLPVSDLLGILWRVGKQLGCNRETMGRTTFSSFLLGFFHLCAVIAR